MEDDRAGGVAQEGGAGRLALAARVVRDAGLRGDAAHQGRRLVDGAVVDHAVPAGRGGVGRDGPADVGHGILRGAGRAAGGGDDLPGGDVAVADAGQGAVADVRELAPLHLAGGARQAGGLALQRL